jgi:hypothetical protein
MEEASSSEEVGSWPRIYTATYPRIYTATYPRRLSALLTPLQKTQNLNHTSTQFLQRETLSVGKEKLRHLEVSGIV